jgi:hypothetical protein
MLKRSVTRVAATVLFGAIVSVGMFAGVSAQTAGGPEKYNATAVNMGSGPSFAGRVLVSVDKWSTPADRQKLLTALAEKGPEKLLDTLQDMPKVGFIRLPNTLAWDLRYAAEEPLPEGGRRVVLATDRPIGMQEQASGSRRLDYPFTLLEIRFNKEGVGVGKMSVYTKVTLSKDKKNLELENFGTEPVRLTEVRIEK